MAVDIDEVVTTVRTVDDRALLSPPVLRKVIAAAADTVQERQAHAQRAIAERRVTGGVSDERDQEA
jgi:uncharacterized protein (DUF2336 family)